MVLSVNPMPRKLQPLTPDRAVVPIWLVVLDARDPETVLAAQVRVAFGTFSDGPAAVEV
ncbi:hypothetical protein [uncultured Streptomyces sp.]|uniref:hypothetical protein n=1 Tax=uncultured Streptomyces sp. TaxID=174707 RepID=UPI0026079544|nr:hypothetical protein [uncultured Streptomyces sp.]